MLSAIINIITLSQIVFFTIFLTLRRSRRVSNQLLIGFLISQGFVYINNIGFFYYEFVYKYLPHLLFIGQAFMFLWAPLLYLYICSLTRSAFTLNRKLLPHFIPFTLAFLFLLFTFYIQNAEIKRHIMDTYNIGLYFSIYSAVVHVQIMIYIVFALIRLKQYRKQIKDRYASLDRINLNWMRILLYSYIAAWLLALAVYIMDWTRLNSPEFLTVILFLFFLVFFNIIVYKALTTPSIFDLIDIPTKEKRKSLSDSRRDKYREQLEKFVEENKPYLSSAINLNELARMVDIPPRSLSEVLNESFNLSFFDYINIHRINEAERLLISSADAALTVSEVIYDVGFNSKSAFYNAFKKYKGYSPTILKQVRKDA